jgi:MFS family permease
MQQLAPQPVVGQEPLARSQKSESGRPSSRWLLGHHLGFWLAALAFLVNMGFSAVPTPLYVLYQARDHFSDITITLVYAVYAIGVIVSLFLAGHLSDWAGRRRIFVPALLLNVVSACVFITEPGLVGLFVARIISGVSVGLTTATATAYLAELHAEARPLAGKERAEVVATASNLGGIGVGPLVAGLLAQFAPNPLVVPFAVFGIAIATLALVITRAPETSRQVVRPKYRPQRIAVPANARGTFFAASVAGLASFAVFGVFNSLVPSFLAGTLHDSSHAVAGAVAFAAFAGGAAAQIAHAHVKNEVVLRRAVPTIVLGLGLLAGGMWVPSLALFVVGGVVVGAGGGLVFKGAVVTAASTAPAGSRAEVLAGFFLGAYIGLSIPVIALGVATTYIPARDAMLGFAFIVAVTIAWSVRAVLRKGVAAVDAIENPMTVSGPA